MTVESLDKAFGGVHAVNHVSFEVSGDEILGLIGPNGSGKTTIVNLISGAVSPSSGEVIFGGRNITGLAVPERAACGIARTFQSPRPFSNLNVFDSVLTVALVRHRRMTEARQKTDGILKLTGLADAATTKSGKLPIERRKWLDLARTLAIDPKLIMLDEVMAGLNPSEMDESLKLVRRINQEGVAIIFIEHVMRAVIELCHRVIVMNEGSILAQGVPTEVMRQDAVINAYLGRGYSVAGN